MKRLLVATLSITISYSLSAMEEEQIMPTVDDLIGSFTHVREERYCIRTRARETIDGKSFDIIISRQLNRDCDCIIACENQIVAFEQDLPTEAVIPFINNVIETIRSQ